MFLVGFARNVLESQRASRPATPRVGTPELPQTYPGTLVQPEHLRRLIDDCFMHLSEQQRSEVFETLHAELLKPKNAAVRGEMIQYFAQTALQVRALQMRLTQLSGPEREAMADDFEKLLASLPAQGRNDLAAVIERHLLPVPADLSALFAARLARYSVREEAAVASLQSAEASPSSAR